MPTKERLERALVNADRAGDAKAAKALANALKNGQYDDVPKDFNALGAVRAGLQGLTFGASDEIGAGLAAAAAGAAEGDIGRIPEIYGEMHQQLGEERKQFREDSPKAALASELAGGLMTGGAGAARLATAKGIRNLRALPQAAAIGGIEGGTYGLLSGDPGERLESAGLGAAGGAVLSPAIQAGAKVAGSLAAPAVDVFRQGLRGGAAEDAMTALGERLAREGVEKVEDVAAAPQGTFTTLADVTVSGRGLLESVANEIENPRIRKMVADTLGERNKQQQSRLLASLDESLGVEGKNYGDVVRAVKAVRGERARPLYAEAREKPVRLTPYMKAVMHEEKGVPEVVSALKQATQRVSTKRAAGDRVSQIDVIDEMKRALDDEIKYLIGKGKKNRVRDLTKVKNRILADVDAQIPQYKMARDAYAGESELLDAAEEGTKILRADVDYIDDMLTGMSESEKHMFRIGAKKSISEKLMQAREGVNSVNRIAGEMNLERMRRAFTSNAEFKKFKENIQLEAQIFDTERVLHNSMTALRQAAQKSINSNAFGRMIDESGGNMTAPITMGLKKVFGSGLSIEAKEELGKLLLMPIQQMPPETLAKINRTILSRTPRENRAEIQRLIEAARQASLGAPGVAVGAVND